MKRKVGKQAQTTLKAGFKAATYNKATELTEGPLPCWEGGSALEL